MDDILGLWFFSSVVSKKRVSKGSPCGVRQRLVRGVILVRSEPLPKLAALRTTHPSGPTPTLGPLAWKHCRLGLSFSFALRLQTPSLMDLHLPKSTRPAELLEPLLQLLSGDTPATRWPAQQHAGEQKNQFPCSRVSIVVIPVSDALRFFESHPHCASGMPPLATMGLSSSLWPSV